MTDTEKIPEGNDNSLLTSIQQAYTVGDTTETETEEMNILIVNNFINTLAEISLSIASRKVKETDQ